MAPTPAEQIAEQLQTLQRPGEKIRKGPGGSLYLGDGRIFLAKYNPSVQQASVHAFALDEVGEVRVETGSETRSFVEIGIGGEPPAGIAGGDEVAYAGRPNVIYCGRGEEAEQLAQQIARALRSATAPPPPPPPPEPEPPQVPADWYPDPHGTHRLRYWDGSAWTDHVAD